MKLSFLITIFFALFLQLALQMDARAFFEASLGSNALTPLSASEPAPIPAEDGMPIDWGDGDDDICAQVVAPAPGGPDAKTAVTALMRCVRLFWNRFEIPTRGAFLSYKLFAVKFGEPFPSSFTIRQMRDAFAKFRDTVPFYSDLSTDDQSRLRARFTKADLEEFFRLSRYRLDMLSRAEVQIIRAIQARVSWFDASLKKIDRFRFLLAMDDVLTDPLGDSTAKKWRALSTDSPYNLYPVLTDDEWTALMPILHPYALSVVLPHFGEELTSFSRHPMAGVLFERDSSLAGDPTSVVTRTRLYQAVQAGDNPALPPSAPFATNAIRVALLNPGVDFVAKPQLLSLLSSPFSSDYADADSNPWVSSNKSLGFDAGTYAATVFRATLAGQASGLLSQRRVEMGVWKGSSLRELLGNPSTRLNLPMPLWGNALGPEEAILQNMDASSGQLPAVVVTTYEQGFAALIQKTGDPNILKKVPWIWIVQAGANDPHGVTGANHCWMDIPAASRPTDQTLCVGTLKIGSFATDYIRDAYYSDTGVDLYEYSDYNADGGCPQDRMTCSAAQVAAAAAIIKANYPKLTPQLIRRVLMDTAWSERLNFEINTTLAQTVNVFHATSMMGDALTRAKKYSSGRLP